MSEFLPRLWNSGNSLVGWACAPGGQIAGRHPDGVTEIVGGWLIRILARHGWASAITLGDVIFYADAPLIPLLHAHERVHVCQGRAWGPFFFPAYLLESAYQWLRTRDGYRCNRFEVAAYRTEAP